MSKKVILHNPTISIMRACCCICSAPATHAVRDIIYSPPTGAYDKFKGGDVRYGCDKRPQKSRNIYT